jgi:hypothetical protein
MLVEAGVVLVLAHLAQVLALAVLVEELLAVLVLL